MARKSSIESGSGFRDEFENPPAGPIGLHRGKRSAWVRVAPYLITVLIAALLGFGVWLYVSGKGAQLLGFNRQQDYSVSSSQSRTAKPKQEKKSKSSEAADNSSSDTSSDSSSSDQSDQNSSDDQQKQSDQNQDQKNDQKQDAQNDQNQNQNAAPNHSTPVLVYNGLSQARYGSARNGYAGAQAQVLKNAGYTNVTAQTKTGSVPASNEVWYADDADKATAQDVASKMGIPTVRKVGSVNAKVEVVLVTK